MDWRAKVELFEEIRREYEFGVGTIRTCGVAWPIVEEVREARRPWMPPRQKPEGLAANAANTRSGVNGTCRKRAPVASNTAFPMAAVTRVMTHSPAPSGG